MLLKQKNTDDVWLFVSLVEKNVLDISSIFYMKISSSSLITGLHFYKCQSWIVEKFQCLEVLTEDLIN